jgi:hypothetical protein
LTETKKGGPFGGLSAQEAAERSATVRKAKAEEREQEATENALTFRQRLGVSLSKLSQKELDSVVKTLAQSNTPAAINTLAKLADQSFGRPQEAEPDEPLDPVYAGLTREQRAVLRDALQREDDDAE